MTPIGGKTLVRMRMQGKRPPGFVVVTESPLVATHFRNPLRSMHVLMFDPAQDYDWRVIHGLDVGLITELPREKVTSLCAAIFAAEPSRFHAHYHATDEHDLVIDGTR